MTRFLFALLVLFAACSPFEPPDGAYRIDAPAAWRELYATAEACTGRRGDFDRITWYLVPGDGWDHEDGHFTGGATDGHAIYVAEAFAGIDWVVKHEMVHELGFHGHPAVPFHRPCRVMLEDQ